MTAQPPPAIDLDQLRELAKAAEDTWEDIEPYWYAGIRALQVAAEDREFIAAVSPSAILALLQELAELRATADDWEAIDDYSSNTVITPPGGHIPTWDVSVEGGTKITGFVGATRLEAIREAAVWCRKELTR